MVERDISVTILERCMCVCACGFNRTITTTFICMDFQKSLAQVFLGSSIAGRNICFGRLKVKVTLEGQIIK